MPAIPSYTHVDPSSRQTHMSDMYPESYVYLHTHTPFLKRSERHSNWKGIRRNKEYKCVCETGPRVDREGEGIGVGGSPPFLYVKAWYRVAPRVWPWAGISLSLRLELQALAAPRLKAHVAARQRTSLAKWPQL
jgi:hypothetical protein